MEARADGAGAGAAAPTALGVFTELSEEQPGERAARPERSGRSAGAVRYLDGREPRCGQGEGGCGPGADCCVLNCVGAGMRVRARRTWRGGRSAAVSAPAESRCGHRVRGRSLETSGTCGCAVVLLTAVSAVSLTAVDAIDAVGHPPAGRCPEPVRVQAFAWHRRLSRARVIAR